MCSITIPKSTDWTDCTAKVICPKMNNNLVKMTSWDCQEGNGASTPKLSSNSIHTISPQINPKNSNFTILRRRLLQLWYMQSYRNISIDAPTVFNNNYKIVMMANDKNLNENIMQKTLICQPIIIWAATERKIGILNACDQRLPEVIFCFFEYFSLLTIHNKNVRICSVLSAKLARRCSQHCRTTS